jgi:hypothetical protein
VTYDKQLTQLKSSHGNRSYQLHIVRLWQVKDYSSLNSAHCTFESTRKEVLFQVPRSNRLLYIIFSVASESLPEQHRATVKNALTQPGFAAALYPAYNPSN